MPRRFRRSFRRRGSLYDMQNFMQCRSATILTGTMTCLNPLNVALLMLTPNDLLETSQATKGLVFGGSHFQSEISLNPVNASSELAGTADFIEVYEALCILPVLPGTTAPAFVPALTVATSAGARDSGVDVLWKRISIMPFWGSGLGGGFPQLQSTMRDEGHGPVTVKTKRRIDEHHGLFHCFSFVAGITLTPPLQIPIAHDIWHRFAVKVLRK